MDRRGMRRIELTYFEKTTTYLKLGGKVVVYLEGWIGRWASRTLRWRTSSAKLFLNCFWRP